ncbi:MAG TPA: glycosyltransferase family 2 protein [Stellaceae bacterium]|nr:glycosyltransferase family 2 protein [Stellaceae bacterium]
MTGDYGRAEQMIKRPISVSFIVPALNEEDVISSVIHEIWSTVSPRLATFEIILIDDGSTDGTGRIMDQLAVDLPFVSTVHNGTNIGLGAAYTAGVKHAKHDYVMMLCGDGGLPAASLPPIIEKIGAADIVVPYMKNLKRIKTPSRFLLSRAYTKLLNFVFGFHLRYYNGLPVHRRALLRKIEIRSSGFGFQGEVLIKLLKSGATYAEVGVLGAEKTNRSAALKPRNLVSVAATFLRLLNELKSYQPVDVSLTPSAAAPND